MPIIFIVVGIFLIANLFYSGNKILNKKITFLLILFEIGFFVGNITYLDITFNVLHLFVLLCFLGSVITGFKLSNFILSLFIIFSYFVLLKTYPNLLDLRSILFLLIMFVFFLMPFEFKSKICFIIFISLGVKLVDVYFDLSNYTFAVIDLISIYNLLFIVGLCGYGFNVLGWRKGYVKKSVFDFNDIHFRSSTNY